LQPLLDPEKPLPTDSFFFAIDILLTAGVLAGGSDAIGKIIARLPKQQLSLVRARIARQIGSSR
jgi:hypothetical protein